MAFSKNFIKYFKDHYQDFKALKDDDVINARLSDDLCEDIMHRAATQFWIGGDPLEIIKELLSHPDYNPKNFINKIKEAPSVPKEDVLLILVKKYSERNAGRKTFGFYDASEREINL